MKLTAADLQRRRYPRLPPVERELAFDMATPRPVGGPGSSWSPPR